MTCADHNQVRVPAKLEGKGWEKLEFSQTAETKADLRKEEHTTAKAKGQRKQAESQVQVSLPRKSKRANSKFQKYQTGIPKQRYQFRAYKVIVPIGCVHTDGEAQAVKFRIKFPVFSV